MSKEVGEMGRSRGVRSKGSARTQGARRATGVRAGGPEAGGAGPLAPGQRWSAGRKQEVVLRLLRGESLDGLSRELGVEIYRLEEWRERALVGLELGLKDRQGEPLAAELDAAKRHIGELSMEIELLRARARAAEERLPLGMRRSRR
jgi:transposase